MRVTGPGAKAKRAKTGACEASIDAEMAFNSPCTRH